MQRLIRNGSLHSQTTQGIVETFYEAMESWKSNRKSDPDSRPPHRRYWYHAIPYKKSAMKLINGMLVLSNGRGNEPLVLPWKWGKPVFCEISYNGEEYMMNATYDIEAVAANGTETAGIDLGEIHPAVVATGKRVVIANGRELRSKRRYQNKVKGHFQSKMDKRKKKSRRWKRLNEAKKRTLKNLDNQIKDILHKQTTAIVCTLKEDGVQKVGIGDLRDIRKNVDYGAKANQKIHQMPSGKVREMITYKAEREGVKVELVNEAYTSQTCPKCGKRHKPSGRNYNCPHCGLKYHRDGVGCVNIRSKTMYRGQILPVVGDMTPPVGIRYKANSQRTSAVSKTQTA
jgi:putative transposase